MKQVEKNLPTDEKKNKEKRKLEADLLSFRKASHYKAVMNIIDKEIDKDLVSELLDNGKKGDFDEIGKLVMIEHTARRKILNIKKQLR